MVHVVQHTFGGCFSSLGVNGHTKFWEVHEREQQLGDNEGIDSGKHQRLQNDCNVRNNKVSAIRSDLAMIILKVCIWRQFENAETDLHISANDCYVAYADTVLSKPVHWQSPCQGATRSMTYCGVVDKMEFKTEVIWASLLITTIHPQMAQEFNIQYILGTLHNMEWIDHSQVWQGRFLAILILDPVDVEMV